MFGLRLHSPSASFEPSFPVITYPPSSTDPSRDLGPDLSPPDSVTPRAAVRQVQFRYSKDFPNILSHLGGSLLMSTYAAGKVITVAMADGDVSLGFANFDKAMGLAIGSGVVAVCTRSDVCILRDVQSSAPQIPPAGRYDRGYALRHRLHTGDIAGHELAFAPEEAGDSVPPLWLVNTLFSCLCTLDGRHSFVPRWRPPFITELAPEDRCHLNGMAFDREPVAVTVLGQTDHARGWRENKAAGGAVMDCSTGEVIADGLCMPHSPRVHPDHPGKLFVLDSGRGGLLQIDRGTGQSQLIERYPGYGRGLAITRQFAIVGMSRARETSTFGGVPICDRPEEMKCGVVVIDLLTGKSVAYLELTAGVDELFDVQFLPSATHPVLIGPHAITDGHDPVWVVPPSVA